MFRLKRYFAILSLIAFLLVAILLGIFYRQAAGDSPLAQTNIILSVILILALAYVVAVFFIVRHGDNLIQQQQPRRESSQPPEALRASEEKYRILLDRMSEGVLQLNNQGVILSVNDRLCGMFGYTREELVGKSASAMFPPYNPTGTTGITRPTRNRSGEYEIQLKKKWKEVIWVHVSHAPITNAAGEVTGAIEIYLDITQRKRDEEALRQARKEADEAERFKSQILANVSHDARTPLSVITLHAEMLQNGIYGQLTDKQKGVIISIQVSTHQLLVFINSLLDEAQLSTGKLKLRTTDFTPSYMARHVESTMKPLADRKALELKIRVEDGLPETLRGDPERLNQILYNLVANAIKFTEQGAVTVRLYRVDPVHWAMEVADTGPGIPAEAKDRIFEAFWQLDGTTTRKATTGIGLGLSVVKQLTELMGGEIQLESEVGTGSTFTVVLPMQPVGERVP
jgi:PAS domain S-box-containing protein